MVELVLTRMLNEFSGYKSLEQLSQGNRVEMAKLLVRTTLRKERERKYLQGDHSACSKPPVDIDLKVVFYYKILILKRNLNINVNGRF